MKANCYICGKEFERRKSLIERAKHPVCSRECQAQLYTKKQDMKCDVCGKKITRAVSRLKRNNHNVCSRECYSKLATMNNSKIEIECPNCNKFFSVWPYRVKRDKIICCSPSCATEFRLKDSKNHPLYNPEISEEKRQKRKAKERTSKDVRWRRNILIKYNFTCQICGKNQGKLVAHHLDGYLKYPDKRLDLDNGVCLCRECHIDFHKKFKNDTTKKQFLQYVNQNRRLSLG